ncbi:MAG TPA: DUF6776 family protein [Gammaproteobacteria bacterium]|nr:DUF6776 family protein [Gammaproteobacteria bacterium]
MTKLIVKHHSPRQTWTLRGLLALAVIVALWAAFVYGERRAGYDRNAASAVADQLQQAREQVRQLQTQITTLQREREVDLAARQQVQKSVESMQDKLAGMQEELAFYKGIVSPGVGEQGIHAQSLKFTDGGAPRLYHYRLVLVQVRTKEFRISGRVDMKLYGSQDGKPVILDAASLATKSTPSLRFAFQYFQNLEGDVILPEGFRPGRVEVVINENGRDPVRQNFDWNNVKA